MNVSAPWIVVILLATQLTRVFAQAPSLAGTWTLDAPRSRAAPSAGLAGLIGSGAPETLHITHAASGTVIVESQINESHSRLYVPGRRTSSPVTVGPAGTITMTSRWDGGALVSEGTRESASGPATVVTAVTEVIRISPDGRALTIAITATAGGETHASTLVYTRATGVAPCRTWPTPCKMPPS